MNLPSRLVGTHNLAFVASAREHKSPLSRIAPCLVFISMSTELDVIDVLRVDIEPNDCPLQAPLNLTVHFNVRTPAVGVHWELDYEADYTNKRHVIALYRSPAPFDLVMTGAPQSFSHFVPQVNTDAVKEKYLLQVGLLRLSLVDGAGSPIVSVNMVAQITKDASGVLLRSIISPLE